MVTFLKTVRVAFELHALSSVRGKQATFKQLCFLFGCQYQLTSNSTQGGVGDNVRLTGSRELQKKKKICCILYLERCIQFSHHFKCY